jgi:hypothetical protein
MAMQAGFPGMHFINTVGANFYRDATTAALWNGTVEIEAAMHQRPQIRDTFRDEKGSSSIKDLALPVPRLQVVGPKGPVKGAHGVNGIQYWGAVSNYDTRPRTPTDTPFLPNMSPELFYTALKSSFAAMHDAGTNYLSQNLYFVTAWNEWNNQVIYSITYSIYSITYSIYSIYSITL